MVVTQTQSLVFFYFLNTLSMKILLSSTTFKAMFVNHQLTVFLIQTNKYEQRLYIPNCTSKIIICTSKM